MRSSPHAGRGDCTREWIPGDKDYSVILESCLLDLSFFFLNDDILRKRILIFIYPLRNFELDVPYLLRSISSFFPETNKQRLALINEAPALSIFLKYFQIDTL